MKTNPFYSVVKIPNTNTLYAVGADKTIKEIEKDKEKHRYDAGVVLSQIVLTAN